LGWSSDDAESLIGRKTVIVGDVGAGKTRLLTEILTHFREKGLTTQITVVDLAPPKMGRVGGPITEYVSAEGLRYLRPTRIYAPRLQACNSDDVLRYVSHNVTPSRVLLEQFTSAPTKILMINDLTIFLHGSTLEELLNVLEKAETFVGTAYYGMTLDEDYGTGISAKERRLVEEMLRLMDRTIRL